MSPARDERRQAVLGLLATHAAVQWHDRGQDIAFADEVLELAARLGRVETAPALRPARVATDEQRQAAMVQIRERLNGGSAVAVATERHQSATQGQVGTTTPPERPGATEGDL